MADLAAMFKKAAGASGCDLCTGEEFQFTPMPMIELFVSITERWEKAGKLPEVLLHQRQSNFEKNGESKGGVVPADGTRPLTIFSVLWSIYGSTWMQSKGYRQLLGKFKSHQVVFGAKSQSCEEVAATLIEAWTQGRGILTILHFSQAFDRMAPGSTVSALEDLGAHKGMCELMHQIWPNKNRRVQWTGLTAKQPLETMSATPQGDAIGPISMTLWMMAAMLELEAEAASAYKKECRRQNQGKARSGKSTKAQKMWGEKREATEARKYRTAMKWQRKRQAAQQLGPDNKARLKVNGITQHQRQRKEGAKMQHKVLLTRYKAKTDKEEPCPRSVDRTYMDDRTWAAPKGTVAYTMSKIAAWAKWSLNNGMKENPTKTQLCVYTPAAEREAKEAAKAKGIPDIVKVSLEMLGVTSVTSKGRPVVETEKSKLKESRSTAQFIGVMPVERRIRRQYIKTFVLSTACYDWVIRMPTKQQSTKLESEIWKAVSGSRFSSRPLKEPFSADLLVTTNALRRALSTTVQHMQRPEEEEERPKWLLNKGAPMAVIRHEMKLDGWGEVEPFKRYHPELQIVAKVQEDIMDTEFKTEQMKFKHVIREGARRKCWQKFIGSNRTEAIEAAGVEYHPERFAWATRIIEQGWDGEVARTMMTAGVMSPAKKIAVRKEKGQPVPTCERCPWCPKTEQATWEHVFWSCPCRPEAEAAEQGEVMMLQRMIIAFRKIWQQRYGDNDGFLKQRTMQTIEEQLQELEEDGEGTRAT